MTDTQKTRCPHCQRAFRVTERQLSAARGMVRCGVCLKAFNAPHHLEGAQPPAQEELPDVVRREDTPVTDWLDADDFLIDDNFDLSRLEAVSGDNSIDAVSSPRYRPPPGPAPPDSTAESSEGALPAAADNRAGTEAEGALNIEVDAMTRWRPGADNYIGDGDQRRDQPRRWPWLAGSALALLALALQLIYFNSLTVAPGSSLRPTVETVCALLGCPVSEARNRRAIISRDLVIRSHPTRPGVLRVDALLVNTAAFDQPFPPLTLLFEDIQGAIVAARTFPPGDYLEGPEDGATARMERKQAAKVTLEIIDPGADAVSYRLTVAD